MGEQGQKLEKKVKVSLWRNAKNVFKEQTWDAGTKNGLRMAEKAYKLAQNGEKWKKWTIME